MANSSKAPRTSRTSRKPRLGRGLSSLIVNSTAAAADDPTYVSVSDNSSVAESSNSKVTIQTQPLGISVDQISPNPYQPRRVFRQDELAELTESISQQGILQPLIVSPSDNHGAELPYVLVAGERRLRAARQAGLADVPCVVRTASPQQMMEWALIENIQRSDLNPIERAMAYREYMDRFELNQTDAAERLGLPRTTVANHLRILDLSDELQQLVLEGLVSFGHAKVLAALVGQPESQLVIARKIVADGLSVRQTERMVATAKQSSGLAPSAPRQAPSSRPAYLTDVEERLTQCVGTRVKILQGRSRHSGRIVVEYYSLDDFDRISAGLGLARD